MKKNLQILKAASVSETGTEKAQATMQAMKSKTEVARMLQSKSSATNVRLIYAPLQWKRPSINAYRKPTRDAEFTQKSGLIMSNWLVWNQHALNSKALTRVAQGVRVRDLVAWT